MYWDRAAEYCNERKYVTRVSIIPRWESTRAIWDSRNGFRRRRHREGFGSVPTVSRTSPYPTDTLQESSAPSLSSSPPTFFRYPSLSATFTRWLEEGDPSTSALQRRQWRPGTCAVQQCSAQQLGAAANCDAHSSLSPGKVIANFFKLTPPPASSFRLCMPAKCMPSVSFHFQCTNLHNHFLRAFKGVGW